MEKESQPNPEQSLEITNPAEGLHQIVDGALSPEQKQMIIRRLEQYGETKISLT